MRTQRLSIGSRRLVLRPAPIHEILPLRHAELRPGLPRAAARFDGDDDPGGRHFGAFLEPTGEAVACVSFVPRSWRGAGARQLRGMATRHDLVGNGIGSALHRFAARALEAEGGERLLWCNARVPAVPFYARLGWGVVSDVFDVPTVGPHREMVRRLISRASG